VRVEFDQITKSYEIRYIETDGLKQPTSVRKENKFKTQRKYSLSEVFFYSRTDAQLNCLKKNFKIYIKIDTKTAPTYFGAVTPSSGSALLVLGKVTVVKITD
jgi:hypothetical protein